MKIVKLLVVTLSCLLVVTSGYSQTIGRSVISSYGNSISKNGIHLQQTIGQPTLVTHNKMHNDIGLRQGFHQPLFFTMTHTKLDVQVFPNPNNGHFSFVITEGEPMPFTYQLFDMAGKLVLNERVELCQRVDIILNTIESGIYHLYVSQNGLSGSFKITVLANQ